MSNAELIALYKQAYESGSCDLRSANRWLRELKLGVKLIAKNGLIVKVEVAA